MVSRTHAPPQILEKASAEELNFILLNINCSALLEVMEVASHQTLEMLMEPEGRLYSLNIVGR